METFVAPAPVIDDPDTSGFWAAVERGEVAVCTCKNCGQVLHLPRGICHACHGTEVTWTAVAPSARLVSWTVAEHQVHPAFPVPYTVVLVELVDAPEVRLVGHLPGRPSLVAGMAMSAQVVETSSGVPLLEWLPER